MAYEGKVISWMRKGFGFVRCQDFDEDIYVHHTAFGGGELIEGGTLFFDVEDDPRGKKRRATNVSGEAISKDRSGPGPRRDSRDRYDRRGGHGGDDRRGGYGGDDRRPRYDSRDRGYDRREDRDRPRYDSRDRGYDRRDDRDHRDSRDRGYDNRDNRY